MMGTIYLGFTCCDRAPKVPKYHLCRAEWNPEKLVYCPYCETQVELSELEWFEKMTIPYFREMSFEEIHGLHRSLKK